MSLQDAVLTGSRSSCGFCGVRAEPGSCSPGVEQTSLQTPDLKHQDSS